jgi:hypothetical protein
MIFTAPFILLGLAVLPPLYWLLRLTPPTPRRIAFPPVAFLHDLATTNRTPQRLPPFILWLRLTILALIIIGLAGPAQKPTATLPGHGPILLVIDNDWSTAADWPARLAQAQSLISAAAAQQRSVALLTTAPDPDGTPPFIIGPMAPQAAASTAAALTPYPWPANHTLTAKTLQSATEPTRLYIANGLVVDANFLNLLHPARIFSPNTLPSLLGDPHLNPDGSLITHLIAGPPGQTLLAKTATGATLASAPFDAQGNATITLPPALNNQVAALTLAGPPTAGSTALLDASTRTILIGLTAGGQNAETPFLGPLYFLKRALPPGSQTATGSLNSLIGQHPGLIILADTSLTQAEQDAATAYLTQGGILLRFAGPLTAAAPDNLTASPLLAGDRSLGGTLSWTTPQALAPFTGPLASLTPDPRVTITRQLLANPATLDPAAIWAKLSDGTPLILGKPIGQGVLVNILTTANTAWTSLALSGLFPQLLATIAQLSHPDPHNATAPLALQSELTALGTLTAPTTTATLTPTAQISATMPPGLYGANGTTLALNLGSHIPAPLLANLNATPLNGTTAPATFGPSLIAAALALLCIDLLVSLFLRGLMRRAII